MSIFLFFSLASIFLIVKSPFVLRRSLVDACLEIPVTDANEEEERTLSMINERLVDR
jgi:hypothetical protein